MVQPVASSPAPPTPAPSTSRLLTEPVPCVTAMVVTFPMPSASSPRASSPRRLQSLSVRQDGSVCTCCQPDHTANRRVRPNGDRIVTRLPATSAPVQPFTTAPPYLPALHGDQLGRSRCEVRTGPRRELAAVVLDLGPARLHGGGQAEGVLEGYVDGGEVLDRDLHPQSAGGPIGDHRVALALDRLDHDAGPALRAQLEQLLEPGVALVQQDRKSVV